MENSSEKIPTMSSSKIRGKDAIDNVHSGISHDDEEIINFKISEIYSVSLEEANEIHVNYHSNRLALVLMDRAKKSGISEHDLLEQLVNLNLQEYAYNVSKGRLLERAAIDLLYKKLNLLQQIKGFEEDKHDRYINFYG